MLLGGPELRPRELEVPEEAAQQPRAAAGQRKVSQPLVLPELWKRPPGEAWLVQPRPLGVAPRLGHPPDAKQWPVAAARSQVRPDEAGERCGVALA